MEKNEAKVRAGKASAASQWGFRGANRKVVVQRMLEADVEFVTSLGLGTVADSIHALVEFYKANQPKKKMQSRDSMVGEIG